MTVRDALGDLAAAEAKVAEVAEAEEFTPEAFVDDPASPFETEPARAGAPGSVLDALRARAAQLEAETTIDLPIPGYGERLWGRYRAVSISRALNDANEVNPIIPRWSMGADVLARAVENLYGRNTQGELEPLAYDVPVRFDDELVDMLGLHPRDRTAREVLVALCGGGEKGESLVWAHYMAYQGWLMSGSDEGDSTTMQAAASAVGERPGT